MMFDVYGQPYMYLLKNKKIAVHVSLMKYLDNLHQQAVPRLYPHSAMLWAVRQAVAH
jgi:hypothetical protein